MTVTVLVNNIDDIDCKLGRIITTIRMVIKRMKIIMIIVTIAINMMMSIKISKIIKIKVMIIIQVEIIM